MAVLEYQMHVLPVIPSGRKFVGYLSANLAFYTLAKQPDWVSGRKFGILYPRTVAWLGIWTLIRHFIPSRSGLTGYLSANLAFYTLAKQPDWVSGCKSCSLYPREAA